MTDYAISNSEVLTWSTCQKKWDYEHKQRLAPKHVSDALSRGILFHELMEVLYNTLMETNMHWPTAEANAVGLLDQMVQDSLELNRDDMPLMLELRTLLVEYCDYAKDNQNWEIFGVEMKCGGEYGTTPVAGRLDLLIRFLDGPHKGKICIVDHKTSYRMWSENDQYQQGQMFKYAQWLNDEHGMDITLGAYNFILYRAKQDKFQLKVIDLPKKKQLQVHDDHIAYAKQIQSARVSTEPLPRSWNKQVCGMCNFKELCNAEVGGETNASKRLKEFDFKANEYGYQLGSAQ